VYDGNGHLLDDGERTYQWDAKNRLIEAKRGADTWQWSYNAFDQRVSEKKNGVVTKRWVWAGGNQPAEERDAAGYVMRRFYPQGEQAGATKFYYTKDHLGSIREVLGANGTVVSSSRYDAWGVRTTVGAQDAASFGFTGHLEHKELGLVFTLYRAYDPATGRWLSRDPIGEDGGINLYGYVSNNPVNLWDPTGESPIYVGIGLGLLVWGALDVWNAAMDYNKEVCEYYSETSKILSDPHNAQAHADQAGNEAGDIAQEAINFAAEAGSFSAGEAVGGGQPGM
jgi:RHS repeat-associated protein